MQLVRLGLIPAAALLIAACSPGGAASPGSMTPVLPTGAQSTPASTASLATRVEIKLTDAMRIEPEVIEVPAGVPVTFVVTNDGVIDHEFFLGDEAAQAEHEVEMAAGGMVHDHSDGISVKPGETRELTYTFASTGGMLAGCHVPGHYAAGMKASITVGP